MKCDDKNEGNFMARVNIEEEWWSDPRRSRLIEMIGSVIAVDGLMVGLWRTAQQYWSSGEQLIPIDVFQQTPHWEAVLKVGLAVVNPDGLTAYVKGTRRFLSWLEQQRQLGSRGGKASAKRPRDERGRLLPKEVQANSKRALDNLQADSKGIQPSGSGSSSKENIKQHVALHPLAELWNQECGAKLGTVRKVSPGTKRYKAAAARWSEEPTAEFWTPILRRIAASDFCNGSGDRGWKAHFDWLIEPNTAEKVLNGMYDNKGLRVVDPIAALPPRREFE